MMSESRSALKLDQLPEEILLDIFLKFDLDLKTQKRISGVSTLFHRLMQDEHFTINQNREIKVSLVFRNPILIKICLYMRDAEQFLTEVSIISSRDLLKDTKKTNINPTKMNTVFFNKATRHRSLNLALKKQMNKRSCQLSEVAYARVCAACFKFDRKSIEYKNEIQSNIKAIRSKIQEYQLTLFCATHMLQLLDFALYEAKTYKTYVNELHLMRKRGFFKKFLRCFGFFANETPTQQKLLHAKLMKGINGLLDKIIALQETHTADVSQTLPKQRSLRN